MFGYSIKISNSTCKKCPGKILILRHSTICPSHEKLKCQLLSCVQSFAIPWTVACQDLMSMRSPRQEYWSRPPFPSPGDLPDP